MRRTSSSHGLSSSQSFTRLESPVERGSVRDKRPGDDVVDEVVDEVVEQAFQVQSKYCYIRIL